MCFSEKDNDYEHKSNNIGTVKQPTTIMHGFN
jgi:hypothetical protein